MRPATTARRTSFGHAAYWLRRARADLREGDVPRALSAYGECREAMGRGVVHSATLRATGGLRRLADAFMADLRAVLEPPPQVAADRLVAVIRQGLAVLQTRDGIPVPDDLVRERANGIATGVFDAFAVSLKPWAAAEATTNLHTGHCVELPTYASPKRN